MNAEREALIRQYVAGEIAWRNLQERGFADYIEVLAALGELGLRPPVARTGEPQSSLQEQGRRLLREALRNVR